jgi:putative flippase GtrA
MRLTSLLPERVRHLGPEVLAFGVIGAGNTVLYAAIVYVAMGVGAVKAQVIATVITTTIAYFANRHWTYRHHSRSRRRKEYSLFFGFNLVGMVIQGGVVGAAKYGLDLSEATDKTLLMLFTMVGVGFATIFRFWAYRTVVFRKPKPDDDLIVLDAAAGLAEMSAELHDESILRHGPARGTEPAPRRQPRAEDFEDVALEAELAVELDAERRARR